MVIFPNFRSQFSKTLSIWFLRLIFSPNDLNKAYDASQSPNAFEAKARDETKLLTTN